MRLLFISNLFPDKKEPWRGLDNATLLQALRQESPNLSVQAIALRPSLSIKRNHWKPRDVDQWTHPIFVPMRYIPKLGGMNHRLAASAIEGAIQRNNICSDDYDLILSPWLFPDACGVRLARSLASLPQLAIAQGSDVHCYLDMPRRRQAILKLAHTTQGIVTRSTDLAKKLIAAGAPPDRVHPVYNGVDTMTFRPASRSEARSSLGLPPNVPITLFVGNFLPVKGLDLLIRSIAILQTKGIPLHLVLIGSGPLQPELQTLANSLGLSNNLHWRGRQDSSAVACHMQAANVVCLSSLNEGVPNVVLEAMAVGRPIVTTDVGGIHEVLGPSASMHALVPERDPEVYASALQRTINQPDAEPSIASHGAVYSWDNCARQHLKLMESLITHSTVTEP